MQLQLTAALSILSLVATGNAAAIGKRAEVVGGFTVSTTNTCPFPANIPTGETVTHQNIVSGITCGQCIPLSASSISYKTITGAEIDSRCEITLFQKDDCSDDGSRTGNGCFSPDGGIKGYSVTCSQWADGTPPICVAPTTTPSTNPSTNPSTCKQGP